MATIFKVFVGFIVGFVGLSFLLVIASIVFRGYLVYQNIHNNVKTYVITVPNYDGTVQSYMATSYTIEDKCISFKDEFGFSNKVCNNFSITEWTSPISNLQSK